MVESSLNLTLRDAPMGCLQNAFCLAGQRMIEPEGKGLGKLLDGLETTAKVLREVCIFVLTISVIALHVM